jgi:hypothetical protein
MMGNRVPQRICTARQSLPRRAVQNCITYLLLECHMVDAKASWDQAQPSKGDFRALEASGYPRQSPKEITSITKRYEDSVELRLEKSQRPGSPFAMRFGLHGRQGVLYGSPELGNKGCEFRPLQLWSTTVAKPLPWRKRGWSIAARARPLPHRSGTCILITDPGSSSVIACVRLSSRMRSRSFLLTS